MSHEYRSIETVWKRDKDHFGLNLGDLRDQTNALVKAWVVTEKVDGMNLRVIVTWDGSSTSIEVRGRTDKAQLPPGMVQAVLYYFNKDAIATLFEPQKAAKITFYGEGFGEGIQRNPLGLAGKRFRVFDVLVNDRHWLSDVEVREFCKKIDVPTVPILGMIQSIPTTEAELDAITHGGTSKIATEPVRPEGIVARPLLPIFDQYGNRVIWKLTYREFDKLRDIAKREKEAEEKAAQEENRRLAVDYALQGGHTPLPDGDGVLVAKQEHTPVSSPDEDYALSKGNLPLPGGDGVLIVADLPTPEQRQADEAVAVSM